MLPRCARYSAHAALSWPPEAIRRIMGLVRLAEDPGVGALIRSSRSFWSSVGRMSAAARLPLSCDTGRAPIRVKEQWIGDADHDLAKQVILGDQLVERHDLEGRLGWGGALQHDPVNQKSPAEARGLSAV